MDNGNKLRKIIEGVYFHSDRDKTTTELRESAVAQIKELYRVDKKKIEIIVRQAINDYMAVFFPSSNITTNTIAKSIADKLNGGNNG